MTILITGATGLVGRALTQSLLDQGLQVRIVTRRPHRVLEFFDSRVTAFEWHPRTEPLPAPALDGVERIIHLMGEPLHGAATRANRARIAASRRLAARRLVESLGRQRVHLIAASSVAVYGFAAGPPLTEATAIRRPKDRLALTLLGCEEAAELIGANGSTVTQVRLGLVIAPDAFPERLRQLHAAGLTWRAAHADAAVPAIDLIDAVSLLSWLARARRVAGPVHAVAPEPLPAAALKALLEQAAPRRIRMPVPRSLLRRRIGTLADLVHSRQRILPQRVLNAGFTFERPDPVESVRAVLAQQAEARPAARRGSLLGAVLQRS